MFFDKTTDELLKQLQNEDRIEEYLSDYNNEFMDLSVAEYLEEMLKKYNLEKSEVINKSRLNQIYGYQIFSGVKASPSRDKLLQIVFGMGLELKETQRLLKIAGVNELYPRGKRDSIIIFAINKKLSITECDDLLYDMNEKTILDN